LNNIDAKTNSTSLHSDRPSANLGSENAIVSLVGDSTPLQKDNEGDTSVEGDNNVNANSSDKNGILKNIQDDNIISDQTIDDSCTHLIDKPDNLHDNLHELSAAAVTLNSTTATTTCWRHSGVKQVSSDSWRRRPF
jgi:hypothetical protein